MNWKKQHKWSSLAAFIFLILFSVSGIILNHRHFYSDVEISRAILPPFYRYHNWNQGLMRGTLHIKSASPANDKILLYGASGIWITDSSGATFEDYNKGLPAKSHYRNVRSILQLPDSSLLALTTTGLYRRESHSRDSLWTLLLNPQEGESFSDIALAGDSILLASRSALHIAAFPDLKFRTKTLKAPNVSDRRGLSLFHIVWKLHSGQFFGLPGKVIVDIIAIIFLIISFTGIVLWLVPKAMRRSIGDKIRQQRLAKAMKSSFKLHRRLGITTFVIALFICVTGWCLRPPLLIPLALCELSPSDDSATENYWNDKLRMIRYDNHRKCWLISTSEGFFSLSNVNATPVKIKRQPPVSVMGLNVWHEKSPGVWLCGSFSGIYLWDMNSGCILDYETGRLASLKPGPPFGKTAVAGYSDDLNNAEFIATYDEGLRNLHPDKTDYGVKQPEFMETLPMSLWNVALETHTGRILFGNSATVFYVFIAGLLILYSIVSGYMSARKNRSAGKQ